MSSTAAPTLLKSMYSSFEKGEGKFGLKIDKEVYVCHKPPCTLALSLGNPGRYIIYTNDR